MKALEARNRISELMARFVAEVRGATAMGQTDINHVAETVLIPLFKEVYEFNDLKNLNTEKANFPGVDLGDSQKRVAIQVTSTNDAAKVKKTLERFMDHKLYLEFDRVLIYILTDKKGAYTARNFKQIIGNKLSFDKDKDIIDHTDLQKIIAEWQLPRLQRVLEILEANFGNDNALFLSFSEHNEQLSKLRGDLKQLNIFPDSGSSTPTPLEAVRFMINGRMLDSEDNPVCFFKSKANQQSTPNDNHFFLGRESDFAVWDGFISGGGYLLVTSPAGGGKSTALARWKEKLESTDGACESPRAVVSQFFQKSRGIGYWSEMMMLAEQLIVANKMQGQLHQRETLKIETTIRLLLEKEYPEGLVVILDGLDEARVDAHDDGNWLAVESLRYALPKCLGEGVSVILSLRSVQGEGENLEVAEMLDIQHLSEYPLPALGVGVIEKWLKIVIDETQAVVPENLSQQASNIHHRTQGNPLYLYHLMDQLLQKLRAAPTKNLQWKKIVQALPLSFEKYVQTALSNATKNHAAWRDALRFMALARSPLSEAELLILTNRNGNPLQPEDWSAIPWEIRRWIVPYKSPEDNLAGSFSPRIGGASNHWVFSHVAIGEAFIGGELRRDLRKQVRLKLAEFCQDWQEHHSNYALRHLPDHLLEVGDWSAIYSLIGNEDFDAAVVLSLPDEPEHQYRLEYVALEAALEADDAERITEFLLAYQLKFRRLCWTHPLRTLYFKVILDEDKALFAPSQVAHYAPSEKINDLQLRCAWRTADLFSDDDSILWHLLLTAQLLATGELMAGVKTIERIALRQSNRRLHGWQRDFGIYLLEDIIRFLNGSVTEIAGGEEEWFYLDIILKVGRAILDEGSLLNLAEQLAFKGEKTTAHSLIDGCSGWRKCKTLVRLAKWNATSDQAAAADYLRSALEALNLGQDRFEDAWALKDISQGWCQLGDYKQALEVVSKIRDLEERVLAYGDIAVSIDLASKQSKIVSSVSVKSREADKRILVTSLTKWQNTAIGSLSSEKRNRLLAEICVAWAKMGLVNNAILLIHSLPEDEHVSITRRIIRASIARKDLQGTLQQISASPMDWERGDLLMQLGLALFEQGKIEEAKKTFRLSKNVFEHLSDEDEDDEESRGMSLAKLCEVQSDKGFFADAKETAVSINGEDWRLGWKLNERAYTAIILAQARQGNIDGAVESLKLMPVNRSGAVAGVLLEKVRNGELPLELVFHQVEHLCRRAKEHGTHLALELARLCRENGWNLEAYDVLSRAVAEPEELSRSWQARSESLATTARILIENHENDEAQILLRLATQSTLAYPLGTGYFHDMRLVEIARLQISCLAIEDAIETATAMDSEKARRNVMSQIENLQISPEQVTPSELFVDIADSEPDEDLQDLILRAETSEDGELAAKLWSKAAVILMKSGRREEALLYWRNAIDHAEKVNDEYKRNFCLELVLRDQAYSGCPDEALEACQSLLSTNSYEYRNLMVIICQEFWKQNRRGYALETLRELESIPSQVGVICRFALWQFQAGEKREARSILSWLLSRLRTAELKWDFYSLLQASTTAAKIGLGEDAVELAQSVSKEDRIDVICAETAEALVNSGDIQNWKKLVVYGADLKIAPWAICGQIALVYPSQAKEVGQVMQRHTPKW